MKFTGFASGCVGKALIILLCIILGVVLAIGGELLVGYVVLTRDGFVGQVADTVNSSSEEPILDFDEETRAMSIMAWGQELLAALVDFTGTEIGSLEKVLGMPVISATVEDVLGVPAEKIKATTLENIGETVSKNLTLNNAKTKFGITFPEDVPLFSDEEFLARPLGEAFGDLTSHKLSDFILITDDTNEILREIGDLAVSDLQGNAATQKIDELCLCQIMDIDANSSKILQVLKYCSVRSVYTDETETVHKTKKITEVIDGVEIEREVELIGVSERMDTLLISEVVDITDDSNVILRKMRDEELKVNELGGSKVTDIVNNTKIGEIVTVVEEGEDKSEPIMIALKDTTVNGLNDRLKTIRLDEIFAEEDLQSGALSLIPSHTVLSDIPSEMTNVMLNVSTATMIGQGLIASDLSKLDEGKFNDENRATKAFILNSSVGEMMQGLIEFVSDPYTKEIGEGTISVTPNYFFIEPKRIKIEQENLTFDSIDDFVNAYTQFSTVVFTGNAAINVDEEKDAKYLQEINGASVYCIPVFNGETDGGEYDLTFYLDGSAVEVKLAVYSSVTEETAVLSRQQFAYAYFDNVTEIQGAFDTVGELSTVQFKRG